MVSSEPSIALREEKSAGGPGSVRAGQNRKRLNNRAGASLVRGPDGAGPPRRHCLSPVYSRLQAGNFFCTPTTLSLSEQDIVSVRDWRANGAEGDGLGGLKVFRKFDLLGLE